MTTNDNHLQSLVSKCNKVACGADFTMWLCDGKLWSAGCPQYGQLGHGTDNSYNAGKWVGRGGVGWVGGGGAGTTVGCGAVHAGGTTVGKLLLPACSRCTHPVPVPAPRPALVIPRSRQQREDGV